MPDQDPACSWTETHAILAHMGGLQIVNDDGSKTLRESISDVPSSVEMPSTKVVQDRGKGDAVAKMIALIQTLWFAIQAAHRVSQGLIVTELELTTLGHVVLNIFIYWCWWNKPLNLRYPIDVYHKKREEVQESASSSNKEGAKEAGRSETKDAESQMPAFKRKLPFRVRLGAYIEGSEQVRAEARYAFVLICYVIIGGMFGAVHCLAWHSTFPTHIEQTLWRVSALVVTAIPPIIFVLLFLLGPSLSNSDLASAVMVLLTPVYSLARISLLALALAALRALQEKAYETPSWAAYIPHIGQ